MSMALAAVLAGLGVALLPPFMSDEAERAGQLVALSRRAWRAERGYHLRWLPGAPAPVLTLRDWLLAQAAPAT